MGAAVLSCDVKKYLVAVFSSKPCTDMHRTAKIIMQREVATWSSNGTLQVPLELQESAALSSSNRRPTTSNAKSSVLYWSQSTAA